MNNNRLVLNSQPSKQILEERIFRLLEQLEQAEDTFDTAIIIDKVNQFYFTGTMQDGLLVIRRNGTPAYFVRKSITRAKMESPLSQIYAMTSYRDMLGVLPVNLGSTYLETEIVPVATLDRIRKYFDIQAVHPLDRIIARVRAVKSPEELTLMTESGRQHQILLKEIVPGLLHEGMSETDLLADMYRAMIKLGYQGVSRFSMFQMEMVVGQIGFGESSIYPTNFDGPGGMLGMCPAVPIIGNRNRLLKKGDLVFVDVGYGVHGYHSDKTQVYSFGAKPSPAVLAVHQACREILARAVSRLKVGAIPADIYLESMHELPDVLSRHFMGYGDEGVRFLGHGVGLQIDELPVIAAGYKEPLQENMVIALEPKCGITGKGMVGVEETYVVKASGPICLTGGAQDILVVSD